MFMSRSSVVVSAALFALLTGGACSKPAAKDTTPAPAPAPAAEASLFERLGGLPAIEAVVDEFLKNVLADERISARFANAVTDPEAAKHLRQMLIDQICEATGGPCKYTGKSMIESHTGMNITEDEFNALVEDLIKALDTFKVPEKEKNELLGALGGMKGDIVGK